ncbi:MAG TPA: hypothetical protein VK191_01660 [Symbiobacteriaceae bacterium]|nr:hypothetical protein [Symbiobacteriaceae bacterium]
MVGIIQLLVRETGIALFVGLFAYVLTGQGFVFGAIGFILSLATAGVYAMGHALTGRLPLLKGRPALLQQALTALSGLLLGWLLLVPLLGGSSSGIRALVARLVALYVGARFLSELIWPVVPVRRPVIKDQLVVQAERLLARSARPYATRTDGSLDEEAVSFVVEPEEADSRRAALADLLASQPVEVSVEGAELVIRPARPRGETA